MGQHRRVFDVSVANRSITNQEDDMMPLVLAHGGEVLFGTKTREEIDAVEPLLDGVIPGIEAQISIQNLLSKARGCLRAWFGVAVTILKDQIAKNLRTPHHNAVLGFVEKILGPIRKIGREHFAKPDFLDASCQTQQNPGIAIPALDFGDFGGDEKPTSVCHTLAGKKPSTASNDVTHKRPRIFSHRHLIGETGQHTTGYRLIGRRGIFDQQGLGVGDIEELVEKFSNLTRGVGMDA
jgi:hypothetical protein